jgi:hypothetical protein
VNDVPVYCVELHIATWVEAEEVAHRWDAPAPTAFADEWASYGSCRFIGRDEHGLLVSVLLVSADRPRIAIGPVQFDG